jgi:MFS family permease
MIIHLRTVWALLIGVMLLALGNGLQGSLVGIRATAENFSATATGIIMSGYYLGLFLSSFVTPNLVTKVGHIRVFAALAAVDATAVLMFPLYVEPIWWLMLRLTAGICTAGLYIVCESWLNAAVSNRSRGQILSIYMIIVYGSLGAGQLLLNVPDLNGFIRFIIVSVLLSLSLVPIALARIEAPAIEEAQAVHLRDLYRSSPLAVVATFANGLGQSAFFSMGAIYGMMQGLPLAYISLMMALPPIGVIVSQYPIGFLSDRYDRRGLMTMLALLTSTIALCSIIVQPYSRDLLIGLFTLFGAVSLPLYSLAVAHANDHLRRDQMLGASGQLVLIYGSGAVLGPSLAGGFMQRLGTPGFMTYMAVIYTALGAFAIYRMRQRSAPSRVEGPVHPVSPVTTPVAAKAMIESLQEAV